MSAPPPPGKSPAPKRAGRPKKPTIERTAPATEWERRFGQWKVCPDAKDHNAIWVKLAGYCNTCGHPDPRPRPKRRRGEVVTSNPFARAQSRDPEARRLEFLERLADLHADTMLRSLAKGLDSPRELAEARRHVHRWMARYLEGTTWAKAKRIATLMADAMARAVTAGRTDPKTVKTLSLTTDAIRLHLESSLG